MAGYRPYGYQYETSPRKVEPDFQKNKNPYKQKKSTSKKNTQAKNNSKPKKKLQYNIKPILYIVIGFAMLFTICYRNSLINESYNKKEELKSQLSQVEKENEQLKVGIESSLNLDSVQKEAESSLGMEKLTNSQKVYISLDKKDYVEPETEEVVINNNTSWFDNILNQLTKIIK